MARKPLVFNGVNLEYVCPICNGNPPLRNYLFLISEPWCDACWGLGVILSEEGKIICKLANDHLRTSDGGFVRLKG